MPLRQSMRLGAYLFKQKLLRREKFPLLVELEPLFACNLKCAGCGKIQQPHDVLKQRMPVEQAVAAIEECGAPMVSIAGGEPLMHQQIDEIVRQLLERKKIVFLCTNAVLLPKHLHKFTPHRNFAWMVHIDGLRERHDESVCKDGVFDQAVAAIKQAQAAGFRVMTNTTVLRHRHPAGRHRRARLPQRRPRRRQHADLAGVRLREGAGPGALAAVPSRPGQLFRKAFADGRRKQWRLNHSPLFLDFLEGKIDFACTAWGIPSYSLLGLAAAVLPARRRLRQDLQGAHRDHRLGRVRPRQGPALRQLHGALRLRADRGGRDDGLAAGDDPRAPACSTELSVSPH